MASKAATGQSRAAAASRGEGKRTERNERRESGGVGLVRSHMITLIEIKADVAPCMRKPLTGSGNMSILCTFFIVLFVFYEKL
jgi:hypothetical protein